MALDESCPLGGRLTEEGQGKTYTKSSDVEADLAQ